MNETSLEQWVGQLPSDHPAHKELAELQKVAKQLPTWALKAADAATFYCYNSNNWDDGEVAEKIVECFRQHGGVGWAEKLSLS